MENKQITGSSTKLKDGEMFRITQAEYDAIYHDYKGEWKDYYGEHPEWLGRKTIMSAYFDANKLGYLLIEGIHFVIEEENGHE